MIWRQTGQFFLLGATGGQRGRYVARGHLHALDILIYAALAEFVEAGARGLGLAVDARADLAEERIFLD